MEFAGGLVVYGVNYPDQYRRAATFADRIFKGDPAGGPARRAADEVRADHQPQDRQGPRPDDPAVTPAAGGSGDRVSQPRKPGSGRQPVAEPLSAPPDVGGQAQSCTAAKGSRPRRGCRDEGAKAPIGRSEEVARQGSSYRDRKGRARPVHLSARGLPPKSAVEVYRVETFIPFLDVPIHRDVYYIPADDLDAFFEGWGEHATIVVDVRPLTTAEALEELRNFGSKPKLQNDLPEARSAFSSGGRGPCLDQIRGRRARGGLTNSGSGDPHRQRSGPAAQFNTRVKGP